jgi:phospholipid transport system substrate-binding protein
MSELVRSVSICCALISMSAWTAISGAVTEHPSPTQVVNRLHEALLSAMHAEDLDFDARTELLAPVIDSTFDFRTIARVITGRYWGSLAEDDKSRFIETFERLSTATYASNFDSFSGESFAVVSEEQHNENRRTVRTELTKSDGEAVELIYVLRSTEQGWQIVNVIANGVSDLSLKRADYTSIIKTEGFDSLLGKLNEQIAQYANAAPRRAATAKAHGSAGD